MPLPSFADWLRSNGASNMACEELEQKNNSHYARLRAEGTTTIAEVVAQLLIDNEAELRAKARHYTVERRKHRFDELVGAAYVGVFKAAKAIIEYNPTLEVSFTAYLKTAADNEIKSHLHGLISPRTVSARTTQRRKEKPDRVAETKGLQFKPRKLNTCWECDNQTKNYYRRFGCKRAVHCKDCHESWARRKPVKLTSILVASTLDRPRRKSDSDDPVGRALIRETSGLRSRWDWADLANDAPNDRWSIIERIVRDCCKADREREAVRLAGSGQKRSQIGRTLKLSRYALDKLLDQVIRRASELDIPWSDRALASIQRGQTRAKASTDRVPKIFQEPASETQVLSV